MKRSWEELDHIGFVQDASDIYVALSFYGVSYIVTMDIAQSFSWGSSFPEARNPNCLGQSLGLHKQKRNSIRQYVNMKITERESLTVKHKYTIIQSMHNACRTMQG